MVLKGGLRSGTHDAHLLLFPAFCSLLPWSDPSKEQRTWHFPDMTAKLSDLCRTGRSPSWAILMKQSPCWEACDTGEAVCASGMTSRFPWMDHVCGEGKQGTRVEYQAELAVGTLTTQLRAINQPY